MCRSRRIGSRRLNRKLPFFGAGQLEVVAQPHIPPLLFHWTEENWGRNSNLERLVMAGAATAAVASLWWSPPSGGSGREKPARANLAL